MTHQKDYSTVWQQVLSTLVKNGLDELGEAMGIVLNTAMKLERSSR